MTVVGGSQGVSHGVEEFRIVTKVSGNVKDTPGEFGDFCLPPPHPNIACFTMEDPILAQNGIGQGIPRVWSNPQLSSHIRPGLEPPQLHQTNLTDAVYEVDVTRGVAIKTSREASPITPERRQSMPEIG